MTPFGHVLWFCGSQPRQTLLQACTNVRQAVPAHRPKFPTAAVQSPDLQLVAAKRDAAMSLVQGSCHSWRAPIPRRLDAGSCPGSWGYTPWADVAVRDRVEAFCASASVGMRDFEADWRTMRHCCILRRPAVRQDDIASARTSPNRSGSSPGPRRRRRAQPALAAAKVPRPAGQDGCGRQQPVGHWPEPSASHGDVVVLQDRMSIGRRKEESGTERPRLRGTA
jgi:hypothetical protein